MGPSYGRVNRKSWYRTRKPTNDDQGTHILDNVYSPPANLLAQVLDNEYSSVPKTEFGESLLIRRDNRRRFFPVRETISTF